MANRHLDGNPHIAAILGKDGFRKNSKARWYEESAGITVVIEPHETMQQVRISWAMIRAALKRKDRWPRLAGEAR